MKEKSINSSPWYTNIILFLIGFFFLIHDYNKGINLLDGGFQFNSINHIFMGQVPYRDFFTLVFPANFYFGALFIGLFGKSIIAMRLFSAFLCSLFFIVIFTLMIKLTKNILFSLFGWLLMLLLGVNSFSYSWNAVMIGTFSVLSLFYYLEKKTMLRGFFTGVLLAGSMLFKQSIGVYFLGGYLLIVIYIYYYTREFKNLLLGGITGYLVVIGSFLGSLFYSDSIHDIYIDTFLFPTTYFSEAKLAPPSPGRLIDIFTQLDYSNLYPYYFYFQLTVLVFGLAVLVYDVFKHKVNMYYSSIFFTASFVFLHNFERASFFKSITTLPLILVVFIYLLHRYRGRFYKKYGSLFITFLLIFFAIFTQIQKERSLANFTSPFPYTQGILTTPEIANKYDNFFKKIKETIPQNERVFVYPMNPMIYYLLSLENPTRYDVIIPGNINDEILEEIIKDLETKQIKYLIYDEFMYFNDQEFKDYAPKLAEYIDKNYRVVSKIDTGTSILVRKNESTDY